MARHGVDYHTVKQAALKLLSQGISPSVQKVRELLGTGSNTTIAEHLKHWREEHAKKSVYHLPEAIPEELIAAFETFWHTAMEQAEKNLIHVKQELDEREAKFQQEKPLAEQTIADLKLQINNLDKKLEIKMQGEQSLQTKLAVAYEREQQQRGEMERLKKQHALQLKNALDEKHETIDKVDTLQSEITQHQHNASTQAEAHRMMLKKERELQEQSEKRWAQLIDQARLEAKDLRKKYEGITEKQSEKIELSQNNLIKIQDKLTRLQVTLMYKDDTVDSLNKQLQKVQKQHTTAISEIAVLKSKPQPLKKRKIDQRQAGIA